MNKGFNRAALAALIGAALMAAAPAVAAERFFDLNTGAAPMAEVVAAARSGGFELWMAGTVDNPESPVVLDRRGGLAFDPTGTALKRVTPTPAEAERVLRIVEDTFWNPGAATALRPDGTVEAYVVPRGPGGAYRFPADAAETRYRLSVEAEDIGGGGAGGGGGGGGAGGSGGAGAGGGSGI